uniref:protein-serine/threonine phosphatase n=1 Tax=Zea mays TaxID=4577 RepID=A0A804Q6W0_MAIZE
MRCDAMLDLCSAVLPFPSHRHWKEMPIVGACLSVIGVARLKNAKLRRSRRLDVVQSGCTALSIVKHGDLMVVANVDDSRVILGIATYDDAITPSSSLST